MIRFRLAFAGITLLLSLAGASMAQVWAGPAGIEIEVTSKGKPVAGARVLLRYREAPKGSFAVLTDSKGRAAVVNLAPGAWNIEVSHEDYLSYVAAVTLEAGKKASETTSFLQATGSGRLAIRVKYSKASGPIGTPVEAPVMVPRAADPIPAPAPRIARPEPPPEPEPEPVELRTPDIPVPSSPPPSPEPAEPRTSKPEVAPPAPAAPPVELRAPDIPVPSAVPEPAPDQPAPAAIPEVEVPPAPEVDEPLAEPEAPMAAVPSEEKAAPTVEPTSPAATEGPDEATEAMDEPAAEPVSPPATGSMPEDVDAPAAAPEPESLSAPVVPTPEPAPEPMTKASAEPEVEETTPEPVVAPEPPVATAPPTMPEPKAPAVETPALDTPEVEIPAPPAVEAPVAEPEPAPPPASPALEEPAPVPAPSSPAPELEPELSEPEPEAPTASTPEAAPAPTPTPRVPSPSLRTFSDRTCPECKPGEWSAASVEIAGVLSSGEACPPDARDLAQQAARHVARAPLGSLTGFAGPAIGGVSPTALELMPDESRNAVVEALGWSMDTCRLLAVSIPRGAKFQGFRYEAADGSGQADCVGDQDCPIGDSTFLGNPGIERGQEVTVVYAVFENRSTEQERRARLTVYFVPATGWRP